MKPNEPSRTALIIARQRAAHQVLDHGSILYDPFAMKILSEDERKCLNLRTDTERTEQLKKIDERSVSRFESAGIAAILRSHGFCAIEDINFQEIASRLGRAVQGLASGHAGVHVVHAKH